MQLTFNGKLINYCLILDYNYDPNRRTKRTQFLVTCGILAEKETVLLALSMFWFLYIVISKQRVLKINDQLIESRKRIATKSAMISGIISQELGLI